MALAFQRPRRQANARMHWSLVLPVLGIALLGLYNMHSSASLRAPMLWTTQLGWLGIGLGAMAVLRRLDYRLTLAVAYPALAAVVVALLLVLVAGRYIMGARRWLSVGALTIQPSEFAKLAVVLGLAKYFSTRLLAHGYSIRALLRPLLWTRPLAGAVALLVAWRRPWLANPVRVAALAVYARLPDGPALADGLWWRVLFVGALCLSLAGTLLVLRLAEARALLLNPWPTARAKQLTFGLVLVHLALLGALGWFWQAPWLGDPLGAVLWQLWSSGRAWHESGAAPVVYWPRLLCLSALALWALLAYSVGDADGDHASGADPAAARSPSFGRWLAPADLLLVPTALVLVQPDLGSSVLLFLTGFAVVLAAGLRRASLIYLGGLGGFVAGLGWLFMLQDYQKRRIWTFMDPEQDVRGAGWNAVQSLIAVGSGGLFGKGHKNGTQTQLSFLPEQHTDFAFSVWAEEQGLFGCGVLLLLYCALGLVGWQIAARARDAYGSLLATGLTALMMGHAAINVGMVIGVLPVVGIPLPLFSYGGSSTLIVLSSVGLLLSVAQRGR